MRLSLHSDYAVRVLIFLGTHTEQLCTIEEISRGYGISKNHLVKIVHELSKAGYVQSVRGKGGGIRLGMDAAEISIGQLVRKMEFDFQVAECFNPLTCNCCIAGVCRLTASLRDALDAFLETLDRQCLADLLVPERELRKILPRARSA